MKTKKILAALLTFPLLFSGAFAEGDFALTNVEVVDQNTLQISFSNALYEDVSMFDIEVSPRDYDQEILLGGYSLVNPNTLQAVTDTPLESNQEYTLLVLYASDSEGKYIEAGVDGMLTFTVPDWNQVWGTLDGSLNGQLSENEVPTWDWDDWSEDVELNAAPVNEQNWDENQPELSTDEAAANTTALPATGAREMFVILFALLIGLGLMFIRKKA